MTNRKLKIKTGPAWNDVTVQIDGHDVTNMMQSVSVHFGVDDLPTCYIKAVIRENEIESEAAQVIRSLPCIDLETRQWIDTLCRAENGIYTGDQIRDIGRRLRKILEIDQ